MMRKLLYSFLLFIFLQTVGFGQCNSYPTTFTPTKVGPDITICSDSPITNTQNITAGQYALINVVSGFSYTFRLNNVWNSNQSLSIYDDAAGNSYLGGSSSNGAATTVNFVATFSGRIRVLVLRGTGCSSTGGGGTSGTLTITQTGLANNYESQNEYGLNTWVGHIYNAGGSSPIPFSTPNYAGYYTTAETINENFGGDASCFPVFSNGVQRASMYTEGFAVRYKMKSTKTGCYIITMTGDDGVRLFLNGTIVFNRWVEQGSTTYNNVLVRLDGDDDLIFDYYENGGANVVGFSMVPFDANSNTITAPATVDFCTGGNPALIDGSLQYINGDANTQNPQLNFQWQISTNGSAFTNIPGATGRTYDPPATTNTSGSNIVHRYKRLVTLNTANVPDINGVRASCTYAESNIVTITTSQSPPAFPSGSISGTAAQCSSLAGQVYFVAAAPNALNYTWTVPVGWTITSGQGTTSITVTTGSAAQNGNISVTATNGCPGGSSKTLAVTTVASPTISSHPAATAQTVCSGSSVTPLSVTASGGGATISSYNWYSNTINSNTGGTLIPLATTSSYSPSTAAAGALYYYVVITNSNNCKITSNVSGLITVNPVHTITSGSSQNVCQNNSITPVNMVLGGGATGVTVTGLPSGVNYSVSGNTLTISGTPTVLGTFNYSVTTTGNSCAVATTSGTIIVGIGNNNISFVNGTSGSVCTNPGENGTATFTAPAGTYFNTVSFASYGSPTGTCAGFQIDYGCHSTSSQSFTEGQLLGNSGTISFLASNGNFGDPCVTIIKRYYGTAGYSQPVCAGLVPGQITGTAPTGAGNYVYAWQMSTTSATTGFGPAPGTNNAQNYTPSVAVTANTWFRRVVTSNGVCSNISAAVLIKVNQRPTSVISGTAAICSGSSTAVSIALTGTAPWSLSYTDGTATTNVTNITASPYTFSVSPASSKTYTVTALNDFNNCGSVAADQTGSAVITVNPRPTATISGSATICSGTSTAVSVAFTGKAPWNVSYTYGAITGSFSTSSNPYTVSVNPTATTTYAITALSDANSCTAVAGGITGSAVITVNPLPSTPTVTKNNDINCGTLGRVTLTNLPSGTYKIHQTGQATQDITDTDVLRSITGLVAGNYYFTVENSNGCISGVVGPITIVGNTSSTTWNGSGWSNGLPDANKTVIISSVSPNQPFTGTPINIAACTLIITSAADVIIPSGFTFTVTNSVTSNGKLIFKNNSSLIQTTNAVNTGEIVYERETSISRYDLTYWSMPVTKAGFTMSSLSPNTLYDKYFHWDAVGSRWLVDPNGASLPMQIGNGYSIRGPQTYSITTPSLFTGIFTGVPNNGNISVPVEADKWNLMGNPYPSAVDAEELILITNKDVLGALYFWTHASPPVMLPGTNTYRYVSSDYIVFSGLGSTRLGMGSTSMTADAFNGNIAAGQAFFAKPTASVINFNNGLRRGSSDNTQFYKTAKTNGIEKNRIWLNLTNAEGAFKQTLLGYAQGATNSIDLSFDAVTMSANTYIDFYSISESKKLAIQARALPFNNTDLVPLGYKSTIAGEFTIAIDHTDGFFDTQEVYLEDKFTGIITDLRKENYTFKTAVGTSTTRFVLRYTNKTLGIDNPETLENSVLVSFKDQIVKITSSKEIIKEVNIYNVGGQLLYTKNNLNASELHITDLHSGDQVILVKVTLENGYSITKKVIFSSLK